MSARHLRGLVLAPLLASAVLGLATAAPAGDGVISGQVVNKTGAPRPVAGIEVALSRFVDGAEEGKATAATDRDGRFAFRGLARGRDRSYTVTVRYKGGEYTVEQIVFKPDEAARTLSIAVYEPTTSDAALRVTVHHMIVTPGQGALRVTEVLGIGNPTDRTYIGGKPAPGDRRETLRFPLPPGAAEVQYGEGLMACCIVAGKGGFVDTMDVKPGVRQIAFTYMVPASGRAARLERPLVYPTDVVEVLVADAGVQISGTGLVARETFETPQGRYLRLSGAAFRAGTAVALEINGLAQGSPASRWIAASAGLGVMILGLVAALRRGDRSTPVALSPERPAEDAGQTRRTLVEALADLDERFAAGEIPEAEYASERAEKKRALVALLRASGKSPGAPPATS